jgi:hypothetical protein
LHHLSELREVSRTILNLFQAIAHSVNLMDDFEDRIAHWALMQEEVRHSYAAPVAQLENGRKHSPFCFNNRFESK